VRSVDGDRPGASVDVLRTLLGPRGFDELVEGSMLASRQTAPTSIPADPSVSLANRSKSTTSPSGILQV